jgi:hypothetical protein
MRHKWDKSDKWEPFCIQCGLVKTTVGQRTEYLIDDVSIGSKAGECTGEKPIVPKKKREKKSATPIDAVMVPEIIYVVPPGQGFVEAKQEAQKRGCNVLELNTRAKYNLSGERLVYPTTMRNK